VSEEVTFEDGTTHKFCEVCGDCVYCGPCYCELDEAEKEMENTGKEN
jgi:hypothetical protein